MTAPGSDRPAVDVPLFLNGEGMRGGRVHPHIAHHRFLGETRTAAKDSLGVAGGNRSHPT